MNYRKETKKTFSQVLSYLQERIADKGFRVLHIHDVQKTLKDKGFIINEYSIVEICNAKFANAVININKEYGVMMPCKIIIYNENGKTVISMPEPSDMVKRFEMDEIKGIANEVELILKEIVDETI